MAVPLTHSFTHCHSTGRMFLVHYKLTIHTLYTYIIYLSCNVMIWQNNSSVSVWPFLLFSVAHLSSVAILDDTFIPILTWDGTTHQWNIYIHNRLEFENQIIDIQLAVIWLVHEQTDISDLWPEQSWNLWTWYNKYKYSSHDQYGPVGTDFLLDPLIQLCNLS